MDGAAAHYANLICAGDNVIISPLVCAKGLIGLRRKCYVEKKHSDNMKNNVQLKRNRLRYGALHMHGRELLRYVDFLRLLLLQARFHDWRCGRGRETVSPTGEPYVFSIADNHSIRQIVSDIRVRHSDIVCMCYDGY